MNDLDVKSLTLEERARLISAGEREWLERAVNHLRGVSLMRDLTAEESRDFGRYTNALATGFRS